MFTRCLKGEKTLVVLNLSQDEKLLSLPVWMLGQEQGKLVELLGQMKGTLIVNGSVEIAVPAMQAMVYDVVSY